MMFLTENILLEVNSQNKRTKIIPYMIFILFIIYFIPSISSYAQKQRLTFQHLGIEQGMSSNGTIGVYQDRLGFIWIITDDALDRYDGYNFVSYRYPKKEKLATLFMGTICGDKDGDLWVASFNGGIEKFDPVTGTFKNYMLNPNKPPDDWANMVISICVDKNGLIWIGSGDGLYKFEKSTETFTSFKHNENDQLSLTQNSVNAVFEDKSGTLWLATGGGLDKLDRATNKFYHYWNYPQNYWGNPKGRSHWLLSITEDRDNILWIGTDGGLLKFDKENQKFTLFDQFPKNQYGNISSSVISLIADDNDGIWFCHFDGLSFFNKRTEILTNYEYDANNPEGLNTNSITNIFKDLNGNIWVGTLDKGLNILKSPNRFFREYRLHQPNIKDNPSDGVCDFYEDKNGKIYIGTNKAIKVFDPQNESILNKRILNIYNIDFDREGDIWIVTGKYGLLKLENDNKWISYIDSLNTTYPDLVRALYEGSKNQYWVGNVRGDLFSLNPITKEFKFITNIKKIIYTIYEDSFGLVWFGGGSTGLYCYNPLKDSINVYSSVFEDSSTITDNSFMSFYEDKVGTLWIGCENGLSRFNRRNNNFTRYYGNGDFLKGIVRQIIEDDQLNLWISTGKGITKFNPATGQFKDFYSARYFPKINFWRQVGFKSKKGELYFGGENGFIRFHPDSIKEDDIVPPIAITAFKKFDKYYPFGKEIELDYDDNYLTFEFAALSYIHSEENQYAYMMEGIDKNWVYCGTRRFATYPNLNPGEYIFKVKGSTCNRVWNEAGTSLSIIILPPWWKTWWAYSLYAIVLLSIFFASSRFYLNRQRLRQKLILESEHAEKLEEVAKMKSDFFANISHEFRTPLTLILGPAEKIEKNESSNPVKDAGIITRNSRRLLQLVNQLLNLSKLDAGKLKLEASPGNIISFVKGLALSFESLSEARDVMIRIKSDKEFIEVYFDKEKMFKTLSNLFSNAFKFTPERENVIVSITENLNNTVEIRIRNTGIGIPQKELPKLFDRFYQVDSSQTKEYEGTGIGLALVKELIELHHGSISVDSKGSNPKEKEKSWTEFTISLPLGRAHLKNEEILSADKETHKEETTVDEAEYFSPRTLIESKTDLDESRTTILVVEDNYDMREYIKESLSDSYTVEEQSTVSRE